MDHMAGLIAKNLGVKVSLESPHGGEICLNFEWNSNELWDVEYDYEIRIVE
jgi:hypothetical protein